MTCPRFAEEWDCLDIPGMHVMTSDQLAVLKTQLPRLSLLIYQNVNRGERATSKILPLLSRDCTQLGIPSLFFNGYNPEVAYLRQSRSVLFYHDRIMLAHIDDFEIFRDLLVREDYFSPLFSKDCIDVSLEELGVRERKQGLEITISEFIAENYRHTRLFHVLNHPTAFLLKELARRVLVYLGIEPLLDETVSMGALDRFQFPIYQSHRQNLQLEFDDGSEYLWAGSRYTVEKFFALRKSQYASLDLDVAKDDAFAFRKPAVRGWDLAGELDFRRLTIEITKDV
jgi:hypothetical protein